MDTFIRAYTLKHWSTHVVTLIDARRSTFYAICLPAIEVTLLSDPLSVPQYLRSSTPIYVMRLHLRGCDTYRHTCVHTCMRECMHACMHIHMHACTRADMHTCTHVCMLAYLDTACAMICIPTYLHTYLHTYGHAYIHIAFRNGGYKDTDRHKYMHGWSWIASMVACMHVYTVTHTQT